MKNRILLCLLAFIFWIPVKAQSLDFEVTYEGYSIGYTVIQLEPPCVSITYCEYEGGEELHIPATVLNEGTNYSVTEIEDHAFENRLEFIGDLTIPNTVTRIGESAFSGCDGFDGNLIIPNSVTEIGKSAFSGCYGFDGNLTLGDSVTIIDNFAFEDCSGFIGNLTIPNTVTRIGESAFLGCDGFDGNLIIPNSVTEIGKSAFSGCYGFDGNLTLGESVTIIGESAFSGCRGFDGNLIIPNSVTEIGNSAFYNCRNLNGTVILPDNVTSINESTFRNCLKLGFVLSDNITNIGNYAFYSCQSSVFVLPDNITTIGNSAFYNCKIANIPGQLQTIGDKAFSNSSISHIVIPNNVTSIGKECFSGCSTTSGKITMTSITTVPTLGKDAFNKIDSLDIFVPVNMYDEYTDTTRTDWSPYKKYISTLPIFIGDGNGNGGSWTDIDNWAGDSDMTEVPSGDVDVFINARAVISSGDIINVNSFSICENGSIIIEDGGQLIHNEGYGQVIMKKEIKAYVADDDNKLESGWYTISSAFGEIPTDDLLIGDDYELYRYDEPNQEWENVKYIANGFNTLEPGRGYIYANKNTTTLEITGNPNTSNVTYNLTASGEFLNGFNLIGNPFTHNIYKGEGSAIYNENLADGYYVLTNNGGWATKTDVDPISPAQGILVKTTKAGALEIKKNTTRSAKRSINNGLISIKVSNEKYEDFAYVTFSGGISLDKISHRNENIPMVYIYDNNASYAIAVMEKEVEEIPIIFEAKNFGKYTMSISAKDFPCKELLLIDNTSGNVTNVLKEDYTFVATEGNFTLKVIPHDKEIEVYTNGNNIIINNISGDAVVNVYDVAGRVITRQHANSNCKFSSESMQKGVYLINVTDENGSFTKKIIVK